MIKALKARDADGLREAIDVHLERTRERVIAFLSDSGAD